MQFGNWEIGDQSIGWNGPGLQRFVIPADEINEVQTTRNGERFYRWILLATAEDWLTQNDLYDLNYAFVYAIAKWDMSFDYVLFDSTLAEQYEQFDREDEDEGFDMDED